jgi:cation diffusion facilitator CzcD-associated flavoprotein CzcO
MVGTYHRALNLLTARASQRLSWVLILRRGGTPMTNVVMCLGRLHDAPQPHGDFRRNE